MRHPKRTGPRSVARAQERSFTLADNSHPTGYRGSVDAVFRRSAIAPIGLLILRLNRKIEVFPRFPASVQGQWIRIPDRLKHRRIP
jgi:hypothetical protein